MRIDQGDAAMCGESEVNSEGVLCVLQAAHMPPRALDHFPTEEFFHAIRRHDAYTVIIVMRSGAKVRLRNFLASWYIGYETHN
jgi:hypothetical protein